MAQRKTRKSRKTVNWNGIYPKSRMITESTEFKALSFGAQVLYDVLCRLRYALRDTDMDNSFWRTDQMLLADSGMVRNSMKSFRLELIQNGFLIWQSHLDDKRRIGRYYLIDDTHKQDNDDDALKKTWQAFSDVDSGDSII
jgi:hypothetical protein